MSSTAEQKAELNAFQRLIATGSPFNMQDKEYMSRVWKSDEGPMNYYNMLLNLMKPDSISGLSLAPPGRMHALYARELLLNATKNIEDGGNYGR